MELKPTTPTNPHIPVYAYTQHTQTVQAIEQLCGVSIKLLTQNRSKDPVEDILTQIPQTPEQNVVLYAVLPIDKAIELRQRAPWIRLLLLQLDAKLVEQLIGKPYDPKSEYPLEVIVRSLKTYEVKGGYIKSLNLEELQNMLQGKTVAVFNEVMRQALQQLIPGTRFVKVCDSGECVEVNPPANKSGVRISFPGTTGRLDTQQMAELIKSGQARIYYAEVEASEVPPCP
jgi:hypothetical protein